jgi:hypothetical protein
MIRRAAVVVLMMLSTAATAQDGPSKADWDAINVSRSNSRMAAISTRRRYCGRWPSTQRQAQARHLL